jgi:hypothetical protein
MLLSETSLRLTKVLKRDDSCTLINSPYNLLEYPPGASLASLTSNGTLGESDSSHAGKGASQHQLNKLANFSLGAVFNYIHENICNIWYGPIDPDSDPDPDANWRRCYDWQECFPVLLDTILDELLLVARERPWGGPEQLVDTEEIEEIVSGLRLPFARAIGSFIFNGVEAASLILSPTIDWPSRIFVELEQFEQTSNLKPVSTPPSSTPSQAIFTIVSLDGSLWGDPALDGALHACPQPNETLIEGYGGDPSEYARRDTKKLWYVVYAAAETIVAGIRLRDAQQHDEVGRYDDCGLRKAMRVLQEATEKIKHAPTY